jgi:ribosomal protein S18 acetylase RimI-like enzyme
MEIRELTPRDLSSIAATHLRAFPESALTALGMEAVRRYYEWQLTGPHDVAAFGAFTENEMAGFCFGGVFRGAMSGFLQKHRKYLAWRVITHPWLLSSPLFRDRLGNGLSILKRFSKPQGSTAKAPKQLSFGILSIAVDPRFQGQGAGKLLMAASETVARAQGFAEMNLSVHPANQQAIRFYESLGWQKVTKSEAWSGEMTKLLK